MDNKEIKDRKELIDVFFDKDDISYQSLTLYDFEDDDEDFLKSFFIEAFGFCGCGCLTMSIKFVRDILNCYEDEEGLGSPYLNLDKAIEVCGNDNITDFMLHWLDTVELTNHGSSVYDSWLEEKGKALRDYLKKAILEEEE